MSAPTRSLIIITLQGMSIPFFKPPLVYPGIVDFRPIQAVNNFILPTISFSTHVNRNSRILNKVYSEQKHYPHAEKSPATFQ